MNLSQIRYPVATRSTANSLEWRRYTFDVAPNLTKPEIRRMIEKSFDVQVISVNTHLRPRKRRGMARGGGSCPQWKRAIVTLQEGDRIPLTADL